MLLPGAKAFFCAMYIALKSKFYWIREKVFPTGGAPVVYIKQDDKINQSIPFVVIVSWFFILFYRRLHSIFKPIIINGSLHRIFRQYRTMNFRRR